MRMKPVASYILMNSLENGLNLLVSAKIIGQRGSSRTLLRDWRTVCLGCDITFIDLHGIMTHQLTTPLSCLHNLSISQY